MKKQEVDAILEEAKKAGVKASFYVWTDAKQYRRGIHTDKIEYVCGTTSGMESLDEYEIDSYHIMDEGELNSTIYANGSDVADEGESEMIVMLERADTDEE